MIRRYLISRVVRVLATIVVGYALAYPFLYQWYNPPVTVQIEEPPVQAPIPEPEPVIEVLPEVPDFSSIVDVHEKKSRFFNFLKPYIRIENQRLAKQRKILKSISASYEENPILTDKNQRIVQEFCREYRVKRCEMDGKTLSQLLERVDGLPESLVLMQAANESAWGTSRFARLGLNYFGQWCYSKGCGIVPLNRDEGYSHEVAKFSSVGGSVKSYFKNINTNPAYKSLREIRSQLRESNLGLRSDIMVNGLTMYSERVMDYVMDISNMIRINRKYISEE